MMYELLINLFKLGGREAVKRALTMPRKSVEGVCKKTGADLTEALRQRDQAVEQMVQFIEAMVEHDFEPTD